MKKTNPNQLAHLGDSVNRDIPPVDALEISKDARLDPFIAQVIKGIQKQLHEIHEIDSSSAGSNIQSTSVDHEK